jgi:hypothetical protein
MRSDNIIHFKIYSKNILRKDDDYDEIVLYSKLFILTEKELEAKKIDKERMYKYTKMLVDDIPKLRLSITGSLEIKEEADILDEINELFTGMVNVTYAAQTCIVCEKKTTTKTPCCKSHLCYRCWFDIEHVKYEGVSCPNCDKNISYI